MGNLQRGEITFQASGKTWTMHIGTNAMCEIEAMTDKTISEVGKLLGDEKTATLTLMRAVFWGSLQDHHEGITIKECSVLIDEIGMQAVGGLVGQAFQAAFPKAKAGVSRPPKATAAA